MIHVLYHDPDLLQRALKGRTPESFGPRFVWLNLDSLPLPPEAVIPGVDPALNRAMLSEYLGILSIQPPEEVRMIGTFTYSIPLKFSLAWALETGIDRLFLPEVDFAVIEALLPQLSPDYLYGVEFKHPLADDQGPVRQLAEQRGGLSSLARGPFKGSLICSRERFLQLQDHLRQSLATILAFDEQQLTGLVNPFSAGALAARPPERAELDRRRSTYGNALERAMALFFSDEEDQRLQIRLGDLARSLQVSRSPLLQAAHRAAFAGTLVLTFCNQAYLPVLQRWLELAREAGIRGLLVVSFDAATEQFCNEQQIATALAEIPFPHDLGELWRYRLEVTRQILHTGLSVLLSDIDAYWLANPMPRLLANDAHIVASQGTYYPKDVFEQTGIVLCCGFIYYRFSAATLHCLEQLCRVKIDNHDNQDQGVLNRWLLQQGIQWRISTTIGRTSLPVPGSDLAFNAYDNDLEAETRTGLRIRLLAHRDFQRVLDTTLRPIISHLYVPKQSEAKISAFGLLERYPPVQAPDAVALQVKEAPASTLLWLASYPRSGNTMLRTWLQHCFGLGSCSVYNDTNDIARISFLRMITGHRDRDWFYAPERAFMSLSPEEYQGFDPDRSRASGLEAIKTHGLYNHGYDGDACIYIFRDGRAALASHAHYRRRFASNQDPPELPRAVPEATLAVRRELEQLIVCGRPQCGYWSDNVCSWLNQAAADRTLCIQFEAAVRDPIAKIREIANFIGRPILNSQPPAFKQLHSSQPDFFRQGRLVAAEFEDQCLQSLFFAFEWQGMLRCGYLREYHWFVVDRHGNMPPADRLLLGQEQLAIIRYVRQCIAAYSLDVMPQNRRSFFEKVDDIFFRTIPILERASEADPEFCREVDLWKVLQQHLPLDRKLPAGMPLDA